MAYQNAQIKDKLSVKHLKMVDSCSLQNIVYVASGSNNLCSNFAKFCMNRLQVAKKIGTICQEKVFRLRYAL